MMQHVVLVNPDGTSAEFVRDADGGVKVGGVDGCGETVGCRVSETNGVFFGLEFGDGADGAENLFLHDLHVLADTGEDGGLDEVALLAMAFTADFDLRSLLAADINVAV